MTQDRKTIMAAGFPRLEPRSLQSQEPYRHDLRTMNSSPAVLPVLCDEICDGLGCELSRDSTDGRQRDRVRATGRPISRFRTTSGPVHTALRCDAPQVHRRYADRASPRHVQIVVNSSTPMLLVVNGERHSPGVAAASLLTLAGPHAIVGEPEPRPARGSAHEMPPVPAGDSLRRELLPGVSGEAGAVWSGRGTANVRTQNTARDWYR
jgi:hypothetical protein